MFLVTLNDGRTLVEGRDVEHFDAVPHGITSIQLTLPYAIFKTVGDKTLKRNSAIAIGRYDYYYCAKQAIAQVMSISGPVASPIAGQGKVTHEVMAGVDLDRNEVLYIKVNVETGDVTVDKFDYNYWIKSTGLNTALLKKGQKLQAKEDATLLSE